MRMRNPSYKDEVLENCNFYYDKETKFNNNNKKTCLEIGMGKGDFILNMSLKHPDINFIGVEKYSSVASVAIKKIMNYEIDNLKVLITDAKNLEEIIPFEIDTIYLNFSDPWPKKRHAKRRLTSKEFLQIYDHLFKSKAHIIMKTDNDDLFAYSLESLKEYGYILDEVTYDLHSTDLEQVETEYERKFSSQGIKIKYLEAHKE